MNAVTTLRTPEKLGLRVEDYLLIARAGAFDAHGKTELIEGDVYAMNAQYSGHARIKTRLTIRLSAALAKAGSLFEVLSEVSVQLSDNTMPEPDISVTSYTGNDPVPLDQLALVVEVSDTTLAIDLGRKRSLYARAGVPEYWVVDVEQGTIHQNWGPSGDEYREMRIVPFGQPIAAATLAGVEVETGGLN
ncbi:Uma2 family endonuclease [Sphingomonas sp. SUN039]|uniref:Uma2 family endonuclease n=1 Tax=Sphingomonas sp. SUN039 TaxID=2937787 RepID=UPI0021644F3D|nr:Uma2 family endonuclease [Sphingomonas sp. SUN039]UVO54747.1 Uma2 family endonuclease [Sphingomonas sp. SUN039]